MSLKNLKKTNNKSNIQNPAFPGQPNKTIEVDVYEAEDVNIVKLNKVSLLVEKNELELKIAEIDALLAQMN